MKGDAAFGNWFAGVTDGEGCFRIAKQSGPQVGVCYMCRFELRLRDDDLSILEEIRDTLGVGKIYFETSNRSATLCVHTKKECSLLWQLFTEFPLRAKKQRDFEIWSEALDYWYHKDWPMMSELKTKLQEVRLYKTRETV